MVLRRRWAPLGVSQRHTKGTVVGWFCGSPELLTGTTSGIKVEMVRGDGTFA